ncbi:hypothetical protein CVU75_01065 [Candidatus Dependentiae bacterium HGW-Dependentiae-1]|nr:MAG: hypothetical protein CVU75_01065 [Candidatus Dependentiae bacterium HGW-Dependentiae-1]
MVTLGTAQYIIHTVSMLLAYIIVVPIAGYARAWAAKKMGDDTPEELGFLSLDPFVHADFVGLVCLLFFGVGWGKNSPVNPSNIIYSPHGWFKLGFVFFADVFCYFMFALIALTIDLALVGPEVLALIGQGGATSSSLVLSIGAVLTFIIYWTIVLAAIFSIIRLFEFLMVLNPRWFAYYMAHNQLFLVVLYFIVIFFVTPPIKLLLSLLISYLATGILHVFGLM